MENTASDFSSARTSIFKDRDTAQLSGILEVYQEDLEYLKADLDSGVSTSDPVIKSVADMNRRKLALLEDIDVISRILESRDSAQKI